MTQHQPLIRICYQPEIPEGFLPLIRHQGSSLATVNMASQDSEITRQLSVVSQHPVALLFAQLPRPASVIGIQTQQAISQQIAPERGRSKNVHNYAV